MLIYRDPSESITRDYRLWRRQTYTEDCDITFITSLFMSFNVYINLVIPAKNISSHHINTIHILKMKTEYVWNYPVFDVGFCKYYFYLQILKRWNIFLAGITRLIDIKWGENTKTCSNMFCKCELGNDVWKIYALPVENTSPRHQGQRML
jgi:hypothetical protein